MEHVGTNAFETDRLICRRFTDSDIEDMHRNWAADPDIQLEYGEPVYSDIAAVRGLLDKYIGCYRNDDYYRWAIEEKSSGENIGQIAFCRVYSDIMTAEVEYCIGKRFWGKGYAGEALAGLIVHTFEKTGFEKIEAYHRCENIKSGRVLEKSAMCVTDTVERFVRENASAEGEVCYCITRDMYNAMGGARGFGGLHKSGRESVAVDFSINEMLEMQRTLQDKYKDKWEAICPEAGKNKLLWLVGEIGEVIDIVKKNGGAKAAGDVDLRKDLVEEMADVLMYYNDVLLCYGIGADELKQAYTEKFQRNLKRW